MKQINLGTSNLYASQLALGCMRMHEKSVQEAEEIIQAALEAGIDFFDHADIYGRGKSEEIFGQAIQNLDLNRNELIIQSKVGIRPGFYDFSKAHILESVDGILNRLGTDYLDVLVLHRPDTLVEPDEVAEAFINLNQSGKVRNFGVSNMNPGQIKLLKTYVAYPIIVNQLQFGPAHTNLIDGMFNVNMSNELALSDPSDILNYCRCSNITVQAWSPFQVNLDEGLFMKHPDYQEMTQLIQNLADQYQVSFEAMVVAWISRHPAKIQTIVGSMNPQRIKSMAGGFNITITRPEWYKIYSSDGRPLP